MSKIIINERINSSNGEENINNKKAILKDNKISYDRGLLSKNIIERCEKILLTIIDIDCNLLEKPIEDYLKVIHKDKKQINNELTAVLITQYGSMPILTVVHDVLPDEIQNAVLYFISL